MENRSILLVYLACWLLYIAGIYGYGFFRRASLAATTASHLVPTAIALSMAYIFLLAGGATVAQFAAGSTGSMNLWSLWFHLWPLLLLAALISAIALAVWTVAAIVRAESRQYVPTAIAGTLMSAFGFVTVGANFPDA